MTDFIVAMLAGASAGMVCDVALFPLDTVKSRLQAPEGFTKAGGFRGIYKGLGIAAVGSAPGAALFFVSYETAKKYSEPYTQVDSSFSIAPSLAHMFSASIGEFMACLVRVPTEVVKLNLQTGRHVGTIQTIRSILHEAGAAGLYRGFSTTLLREIPFSALQFPMYERIKLSLARMRDRKECNSFEAACAGSFSGAVSAAITTPLDVAKTRLMLGRDLQGVEYRGTMDTLIRLYREGGQPQPAEPVASTATTIAATGGGFRVLFSGVGPRTAWIGIGGFVFFGAYEFSKKRLIKAFE